MLNMGFIEDINAILESVPAEAPNIVVLGNNAAGPIRKIAEKFMKNPEDSEN